MVGEGGRGDVWEGKGRGCVCWGRLRKGRKGESKVYNGLKRGGRRIRVRLL